VSEIIQREFIRARAKEQKKFTKRLASLHAQLGEILVEFAGGSVEEESDASSCEVTKRTGHTKAAELAKLYASGKRCAG